MVRRNDGFTLIELLIVVAIIGILAAIAVPNFLNARIRAKVAKTEAEMKTFSTACEMYRLDNGKYFPHAGWPSSVIHAPWQNKYLTTPIAYVASQPRDIFQDVTIPDENAWNLTFGMYHLENIYNPDGSFYASGAMDPRSRVPNNPADVQRALAGKPDAYELWSIGPNERLDYYVSGSGINGFIYYRPSNGSRSVGDIVWIRP
ncbi:MAG: prepilin-type N-terminal cleavage/methylation domain-containing protein [bacterium]